MNYEVSGEFLAYLVLFVFLILSMLLVSYNGRLQATLNQESDLEKILKNPEKVTGYRLEGVDPKKPSKLVATMKDGTALIVNQSDVSHVAKLIDLYLVDEQE